MMVVPVVRPNVRPAGLDCESNRRRPCLELGQQREVKGSRFYEHKKTECVRIQKTGGAARRVRHSVAMHGRFLLFCDQSMHEKAWRSRKRGA
jgi:hypothetical protein